MRSSQKAAPRSIPMPAPRSTSRSAQIMNEQVYWAPLWVPTRFGGVSTGVENFVWVPAPGGGRYYDQAELWSLAA